MLKLIYLARRKPGYSFDQFVRRWRRHGALGMAQPFWRHALGYVQAEPIRPVPVPGASADYDAVACYMIDDDMFADMTGEDIAGAARMAEDELETFAAPIPTTSLWVTEDPIRSGELGGIAAYLFFADAARARESAQLARRSEGPHRIILNERMEATPGPQMNTLPYEAVLELSTSDIPALGKALGTQEDGLLAAADLAVVTREAVLWDRLHQACNN